MTLTEEEFDQIQKAKMRNTPLTKYPNICESLIEFRDSSNSHSAKRVKDLLDLLKH